MGWPPLVAVSRSCANRAQQQMLHRIKGDGAHLERLWEMQQFVAEECNPADRFPVVLAIQPEYELVGAESGC